MQVQIVEVTTPYAFGNLATLADQIERDQSPCGILVVLLAAVLIKHEAERNRMVSGRVTRGAWEDGGSRTTAVAAHADELADGSPIEFSDCAHIFLCHAIGDRKVELMLGQQLPPTRQIHANAIDRGCFGESDVIRARGKVLVASQSRRSTGDRERTTKNLLGGSKQEFTVYTTTCI